MSESARAVTAPAVPGNGVVYGPVRSRRLGRSLGINLLPSGRKLCSFDCLYCEYGRTERRELSAEEQAVPPVLAVLAAVKEALDSVGEVDFLTFSGHGEPTLHPHFPAVVSGVRRLRDLYRPRARLAVLTNGSTIHLGHVRDALRMVEAPIVKLDAGDVATFRRLNRPHRGVRFEDLVEGLRRMPAPTVQCVLVDGEITNSRGPALEAWMHALREIRPARVQLCSVDWKAGPGSVGRVPPLQMERVAKEVEDRIGLPVQAFWARW